MTPKRGIIIGTGYFSEFHLDAWQRLEGAEIVAVCDLDQTKAQEAASRFGIPNVETEAAACLDRHRPDFVDIATPPKSHLELIKSAIDRKIPVICQKPLAPDYRTAKEIVNRVTNAGLTFMVHENFRWQPWHRAIKALLDASVVGARLHSLTLRCRTGDGWGDDAYLGRQPYFRTMPRLLIHETGVHFIDVFRFLGGEVTSVFATLRRLNPVILGEDTGIVQLTFESGGIGIIDLNRYNESLTEDPRYTFGELTVEADGGSIWLDFDGGITVKPLGLEPYQHKYHHQRIGFAGDCVFATQEHFLSFLNGDIDTETSGADYLKTLQIVEAVYSASESGTVQHPIDV